MVSHLDQWLYGNAIFDINSRQLAEQIQDYSLRMYKAANEHAQTKDLILGDTKFEFGLDVE